MSKCVGVSVAHEKDGWFNVEWCFLEFPWEEDPEMDERLRQDNPFRERKTVELKRYDFKRP
jgi:hypothetical protein